MATNMADRRVPVGFQRAAGWPEYISASLAIVLLGFVLAAVWNGRGDLHTLNLQIAVHLTTMICALSITPWMLIGAKGVRLHRQLGYLWCGLLTVTAVSAIFIRTIGGGFSIVHVFVLVTLIGVPRLIYNARKHKVAQHRYSVLGMIFGAVLTAGLFAFAGSRYLGVWLFG